MKNFYVNRYLVVRLAACALVLSTMANAPRAFAISGDTAVQNSNYKFVLCSTKATTAQKTPTTPARKSANSTKGKQAIASKAHASKPKSGSAPRSKPTVKVTGGKHTDRAHTNAPGKAQGVGKGQAANHLVPGAGTNVKGPVAGIKPGPQETIMSFWNGESQMQGWSWSHPDTITFSPVTHESHSSPSSIEMHVWGAGWRGGAWHNSTELSIRDASSFSIYIKVKGDKPVRDLDIKFRSSYPSGDETEAKMGKSVSVKEYCGDFANGQWNLVKIPVSKFLGGGFDASQLIEIDFSVYAEQPVDSFLYLDDLNFNFD